MFGGNAAAVKSSTRRAIYHRYVTHFITVYTAFSKNCFVCEDHSTRAFSELPVAKKTSSVTPSGAIEGQLRLMDSGEPG